VSIDTGFVGLMSDADTRAQRYSQPTLQQRREGPTISNVAKPILEVGAEHIRILLRN